MKIREYLNTVESKRAEIEGCKVLQQRYKDKQAFLEVELETLLKMNVGPVDNTHIRN